MWLRTWSVERSCSSYRLLSGLLLKGHHAVAHAVAPPYQDLYGKTNEKSNAKFQAPHYGRRLSVGLPATFIIIILDHAGGFYDFCAISSYFLQWLHNSEPPAMRIQISNRRQNPFVVFHAIAVESVHIVCGGGSALSGKVHHVKYHAINISLPKVSQSINQERGEGREWRQR